uniref:Uncharacterized protein n=1 Tax=Megaviridae environmental sample TaxID=1737588 RepID=A0A5J6VLI3_9VIRU|nr:MAG: hypothetical protein [Megaviridae environmental sample]
MIKSTIPVVIIHRTYKDYLNINLQITGSNNKIYLIGDTQIANLGHIDNVTFVNINKYENIPLIKESYKHFINYSSNSKEFEWGCFERIFILQSFMKEFDLKQIFHIDSDNVLLDDINNYPFEKNIAYCVPRNWHEYRMSNSIHSSLLNQEFCDKFIELFSDLYINKRKFYLIKDKIMYHTKNPGGICDMTLYYLLIKEKIIDVQNLLNPINNIVFINNINNGEGIENKHQFKLDNNKLDILLIDGKFLIYDIINNQPTELFNIHFQGGAKYLLNSNLKTIYNKKTKYNGRIF